MRSQREVQPRPNRKRGSCGFSLIELLIVVAVILVIASIAIPNFIRSKISANEGAAIQDLRNITTAEVVYSTTYGIGYSPDLVSMGGSSAIVDQTNAQLVDSVLAAGSKTGYFFTYTVIGTDALGHVQDYALNADPQSATTGQRHFYADQTGVIRENQSVAATATDLPIQ